jgi:hypothetical protein
MAEIIEITLDNISEVRTNIGQSDKKVKNAMMEFNKTPESGEFEKVTTKEFDIPEVVLRTSLGMMTTSGEFVSENTIFASTVTDIVIPIANGDNKGKHMLKQDRISGSDVWGANSQDKRLFALIGKSFTTEQVPGRALKSYDIAEMMTLGKTVTEVKKLKDNTEPKTYHKFVVS